MTGKEHTNHSGARKGARALSQPKPAAAATERPADQETTGGRQTDDAGGAAAPAPERNGPFVLELPLSLEVVTGRDPEAQPDHWRRAWAAGHGLEICESLFWAMQQLGRIATGGGWVYRESDLYEALDNLGELGKAVASGAGEQVQHLEHIADRLHAGREGGHDHDQT